MERYFTEVEAAAAAGVSPETIREFASIGILNSEDREGRKVFSERELEGVFRSIKTDILAENAQPKAADHLDAGSTFTAPPPESAPAQFRNTFGQGEKPEAPKAEAAPRETEPKKTESPAQEASYFHHGDPTVIEHNSFEFLELNRTLREQIQIMREERDWLRKRVEVLEVRAERDQMLLLSESRKVQNLLPEPKPRSRWFGLPWNR